MRRTTWTLPGLTLTGLALLASLATAESPADVVPGIQNHWVQQLIISAPCEDLIATIDHDTTEAQDAAADGLAEALLGMGDIDAALAPFHDIMRVTARKGMAFAALLGFEIAHPGIRGEAATILTRLRADCAKAPDRPAIDFLNSYVAE